MSQLNTAIIPLNPDQRRAWIHYQLRLRGLSMAEIARREGLARNTPKLALYQPYLRMERIIARAIDCTPQQVWPERFNADGTRKRAKPGPKPKISIRKDNAGSDGGNVRARGAA